MSEITLIGVVRGRAGLIYSKDRRCRSPRRTVHANRARAHDSKARELARHTFPGEMLTATATGFTLGLLLGAIGFVRITVLVIYFSAAILILRGTCYNRMLPAWSFVSTSAPSFARRKTLSSRAIVRSGGLIAFALALVCSVPLIRYHRVSRNSAALILPSFKHFLPQPFSLAVIRHCRIPHFFIHRHKCLSTFHHLRRHFSTKRETYLQVFSLGTAHDRGYRSRSFLN